MAAPLSPEPLLSSLLADLTSDLDLTLFPPADVTTSGSGGLETEQHGEDGKKRARAKNGIPSVKEVQDLEREVAAKLAQARQLAAENQALVDKQQVLDMVMAAHEDLTSRLRELKTGTLGRDPLADLGMCLKDLQAMSPQGVLDVFKGLQVTAGKELVTYELTGVVTPALKQLGKGMVDACKYLGLVRPDIGLYYSMHVDSLIDENDFAKSAESMPRPPQGFWRQVAVASKLQPQALRHCAVLQSLSDQWLGRVHAERRALLAALHETCSSTASIARYLQPAGGRTGSGSSGSGNGLAPAPLYASQQPAPLLGGGLVGLPTELPEETVVTRLHANIQREGNLIMLVGEVMYCRILSELEGTRMVVHSHPFIPDDLAILCELAQLAKEQQEQAKTTGQ